MDASHLVPLGLIGIIVFAAIALAGVILSNRPASPAAIATTKELPQQKAGYLKEVHVFAGGVSPPTIPRFSAKFSRNGQRGRIYVDDSWFAAGLGSSFWTARRRIFLAEIKDFVAEQAINIPVLSSVDSADGQGQKMWRWGDGTTDPQTVYNANVYHQGRIVFISDDAPPEHFYFIIPKDPINEPPYLIDRKSFDFVREWEAEDGKQN